MRKMCQSEQFVTWDPGFCHVEDQRTFFADVITCDPSFCHMEDRRQLLTLLRRVSSGFGFAAD